MLKYFSEIVDRYFIQWISPITWDSMYPDDLERFYQFVKAMQRYSRKDPLERLPNNIVKVAKHKHPDADKEHLRKMAEHFTQLARILCTYSAAPFPDPITEKRELYEASVYFRALTTTDEQGNRKPLYTTQQIEKLLAQAFNLD